MSALCCPKRSDLSVRIVVEDKSAAELGNSFPTTYLVHGNFASRPFFANPSQASSGSQHCLHCCPSILSAELKGFGYLVYRIWISCLQDLDILSTGFGYLV